MQSKILVCCHRKLTISLNSIFLPILCGSSLSNEVWDNVIRDDSGDNISNKNKSYCELTGMYWAWKNFSNIDYIGLCHYRRFFLFSGICPIKSCSSDSEIDLSIPDFDKIFKSWDIILPKQQVYPYNLKISYCLNFNRADYEVLKDVIHQLTPEYDSSFHKTMNLNNSMSSFNMFVMPFPLFSKYSEWLFCILGEVERRIDISNYSVQQARIFGYMSERLLNVFVEKHNLKVKYSSVLWINDGFSQSLLYSWMYRIAASISFFFNKPCH